MRTIPHFEVFILFAGIQVFCYKRVATLFSQICLVNDPRPQNPYGKLYSVEFLGNMVEGRRTLYNNQPIQLLKKAAADSIKEGEVGLGKQTQLYR